MDYQQYDRYPSYKTTFVPSEKRTNQDLAYEQTGKYIFVVDHDRKEQRVYEVVSIVGYANEVKRRIRNKKSVDPDFSVQEMYDSNGKIWDLDN